MKNALLYSTAITAALEDRISLANVSLGAEDNGESSTACIHFDLIVDGKTVGSSLEWLDEDGDLVREDRHLHVNRDTLYAARDVLDDDEIDADDVGIAVAELLRKAVEEFRLDLAMREAVERDPLDAGDLFDFDDI